LEKKMASNNSWHTTVPDDEAFVVQRRKDIEAFAEQTGIRKSGLDLLNAASEFGFGHKNSWLGVPIIRLPEDMLIQQEIIWKELPDLIIEVGVARGGGLIFNASIQSMCGLPPKVVGVDNKVFEHTSTAVNSSSYSQFIEIVEGDSISQAVLEKIARYTENSKKALLVLDSDHSSDHVLNELRSYTPLLPKGSVVIVCDTLIDELPPETYPDRSWSDGKGPLDAITRFLSESNELVPYMRSESRSLILTEIRDGLLLKV
jgi:cephalosporin hydroxylase